MPFVPKVHTAVEDLFEIIGTFSGFIVANLEDGSSLYLAPGTNYPSPFPLQLLVSHGSEAIQEWISATRIEAMNTVQSSSIATDEKHRLLVEFRQMLGLGEFLTTSDLALGSHPKVSYKLMLRPYRLLENPKYVYTFQSPIISFEAIESLPIL